MRRIILGLTLVMMMVAGCGGGDDMDTPADAASPSTNEHTLTGTLEASECGGGYDIKNASVEIRDESDKLIGATTTSINDIQTGFGCKVSFTVEGLPQAEFYQITIGTHGGPSYTFDELEANNWNIALNLD